MCVPENPSESAAPCDLTPAVRHSNLNPLSNTLFVSHRIHSTTFPLKPVCTQYPSAGWGWYLTLSLLPEGILSSPANLHHSLKRESFCSRQYIIDPYTLL